MRLDFIEKMKDKVIDKRPKLEEVLKYKWNK